MIKNLWENLCIKCDEIISRVGFPFSIFLGFPATAFSFGIVGMLFLFVGVQPSGIFSFFFLAFAFILSFIIYYTLVHKFVVEVFRK